MVTTNRINPTLTILAAPTELSSVIANMIQNAIQVCEDKPEIEVWAGAINQHMMLIRVSDNGPGIPSDIIDQVFDPFFTTKSSDAGSGFGLYNCKLFVENHKGYIDFNSREGKGTTFFFFLPLDPRNREND